MLTAFIPQTPLETAVLFLVFNRPDTTSQVFEVIRQAQPPRLYIASDGPRANRDREFEMVDKVREIATRVDWPCEVKTLFREENLGCKYAVSSGITWFFKYEEQGIILEDDCLPSLSFFWYCEAMLNKASNNKKIWMITGFNPRYPGHTTSKSFLSHNPSVWGWASWRDRWDRYDVNMTAWKSISKIQYDPQIPQYVINYYNNVFEKTYNGLIDTWDYQLTFQILANNDFVIKPYCNLIKNIGVLGTHASIKDQNHYVELGSYIGNADYNLDFDYEEDLWFFRTRIKTSKSSILLRFIRRIKNISSLR
jgi:hypothetical protein